MFELEREIESWVNAVASCGGTGNAAELEDHLRSEIEALLRSGSSEQAAFHEARQRLGDTELLTREYSKNLSVLSLLCQAERRLEASATLKSGRVSILAQSLAWASVMIAVALVTGKDYGSLMPILLAGWFASTMLPSAGAELACLRRRFSRRRTA